MIRGEKVQDRTSYFNRVMPCVDDSFFRVSSRLIMNWLIVEKSNPFLNRYIRSSFSVDRGFLDAAFSHATFSSCIDAEIVFVIVSASTPFTRNS